MAAIYIEGVSKSYEKGKVTALKDINLTVGSGELFGLIGPDGAGKTTLFRIIATLLLSDKGTVRIGKKDVVEDYKYIRRHLGYMPGRFSLYQDLSVEENLQFFASVFQTTINENYHLIRDIYVQLEPFKKRRAGKLSGGMKQKLALCCSLIHSPEVLLLDEPTTGVDPVSRKEFWEMLRKLRESGLTILVSTPYMDEAALCDRIGLIQHGKILQIDTPSGIVSRFSKTLWRVQAPDMYRLLSDLREYNKTYSCHSFGDSLHLTLKEESAQELIALKQYLTERGYNEAWFTENLVIEPIVPTVEDCFMAFNELE